MKRKICELSDFKLLDDGSGSFEGYGSTFGNFDRAREAVVRGAFSKSLDAFKSDGFIAVGHDWQSLPVATIEEAYEDEKGLYLKGAFHSTPEAQSARTVVKERLERGKTVGLSVGYEVKSSEPTPKGTLLKEIVLYEVSIVTVPCNPQASATGAKEFKAQYLGDYAEAEMTYAALRDLSSSLFYNCIWDCLFYEDGTRAEKLAKIEGALNEFRDISLRVCEALIEDAPGEEEMAAMKAAWQPSSKDLEGLLLEGKSYEDRVSTVLEAVGRLIESGQDIHERRQVKGRTLSKDRRSDLESLRAKLDDLLALTTPRANREAVRKARIDHLKKNLERRFAACGDLNE